MNINSIKVVALFLLKTHIISSYYAANVLNVFKKSLRSQKHCVNCYFCNIVRIINHTYYGAYILTWTYTSF